MLDQIRAQVRRIPRGRVMTYGEVAEKAGYPGAARQVVWALRNSGPAIPWHRVVGAGLRIRLPGEAGMEQQLRLESEGWQINRGRLIPKTPGRRSKTKV
jgi:methylated-DNA-protein-cysteine methyltransferase-like protein